MFSLIEVSRRQWLVATGVGVLSLSPLSRAQSWPAKPIRLVVPFPPGGLIDDMARQIAPRLAQELDQPVVIDNKPGAGGNVGAAEVTRAVPDGHTLLMASPALTISPALYRALPYRPEQLAPVAVLGRVPNVLLVRAASDIASVAQLSALAKASPARLNYASNGTGTSLHLSAELYKHLSGTFVTHIPYRGAAAAMTALIAGEVDMMFDNLPPAMGQIRAGTVRALAVTTTQRSKSLPAVPTMIEAGLPGFDVSAWFGLAAPAGTPAPIVTRLEQVLERMLKLPELVRAMQAQGAEPDFLSSRFASGFLAADAAKWKLVASFANIALD